VTRRLLVAVGLLCAGAAAAVVAGGATDGAARDAHRSFQRAVGGLGLGTALDLAEGVHAFDPRLGIGSRTTGPTIGDRAWLPLHGEPLPPP
jgi:hypothetical protein